MNWVWENREWFLSGLGVLLISAVISLVRRFLTPVNAQRGIVGIENTGNVSLAASPVATGQNVSQIIHYTSTSIDPTSTIETGYSSTPTQEQIIERIAGLPLYERANAYESYVGLRVSWRVKLLNVEKQTAERVLVHMRSSTSTLGGVLCPVEIAKSPRIKTVLEGDELEVRGIIESVRTDGRVIFLKEVTILFH